MRSQAQNAENCTLAMPSKAIPSEAMTMASVVSLEDGQRENSG